MLTDDQLEDLLRGAFQTGPEPDATRVLACVARATRPQHHRSILLPAGAAVAAAGVAVGLATVGSPGHVAAPPNARTVAYRTSSAVADANADDLASAQTTQTGASGTVVSSYDWWQYEGAGRHEQLAADGSPTRDMSWTVGADGMTTTRVVDYTADTWYDAQSALPEAAGSGFALALGDSIRYRLQNGNYDSVQSTTLNGQPALELSGVVTMFAGGTGVPPGGQQDQTGASTDWTMWVDPTTYLPMQMVETAPDGTKTTTVMEWLAPTTGDLAQLTAPVPAGFTEVPAPAGSSTGPTGPTGPTGTTGAGPTGATGG